MNAHLNDIFDLFRDVKSEVQVLGTPQHKFHVTGQTSPFGIFKTMVLSSDI